MLPAHQVLRKEPLSVEDDSLASFHQEDRLRSEGAASPGEVMRSIELSINVSLPLPQGECLPEPIHEFLTTLPERLDLRH
jgi:hypothetical protein